MLIFGHRFFSRWCNNLCQCIAGKGKNELVEKHRGIKKDPNETLPSLPDSDYEGEVRGSLELIEREEGW